MEQPENIEVEVAYAAGPERQSVIAVRMPAASTLEHAILASGILAEYPEIDLTRQKTGIYGQQRPLDTPLNAGDRVEIYRPLAQHPMEARRRRLQKT